MSRDTCLDSTRRFAAEYNGMVGKRKGAVRMEILYALFIALASNLDTIGVRIAYTVQGIKVSHGINLWMALIGFTVSALASRSGTVLAALLPGKSARLVSMVLLVLIGLWMMLEPYLPKREKHHRRSPGMLEILADPLEADRDRSKHIDFKEATVLGTALSLNNIGGGFSAGILGINWLLMGFLSALISWLVFWAGNQLTGYLDQTSWGTRAPLVAGLLLILMGLKQLF